VVLLKASRGVKLEKALEAWKALNEVRAAETPGKFLHHGGTETQREEGVPISPVLEKIPVFSVTLCLCGGMKVESSKAVLGEDGG